ncbi:MAG: cob(I)yrinic acid a,c-diamide adenosyltransferase [Alphaproteobacteria bacterium]|jgi:cob(I)alamin adenosyltransferase|nr:cob(I)yrinic acid a,c-diamide adenosyltransferase [Alphaproteobacteria bacterium]
MVQLTKIYTRGGDKGETSLGDGSRVAKHDLRVESYGTVDEANAVIGLVRVEILRTPDTDDTLDPALNRIQNDLFDLGADLCTPEDGRKAEGALRIISAQVDWLESEIDRINGALDPLSSFILPGGTPVAAQLHLARTVTRRAERLITALAAESPVNPEAVKYLNRLSDLLFVMSRAANGGGADDVLWVPGGSR